MKCNLRTALENVHTVYTLSSGNDDIQMTLLPNHPPLSHSSVVQAVCDEKASQLGARERDLASLQSEVARLKDQLGASRERLEDREADAGREQSRSRELLESLRSEFSAARIGLEERCRSLEGEVAELREEGARREREDRERVREAEKLQSHLQQATEVYSVNAQWNPDIQFTAKVKGFKF